MFQECLVSIAHAYVVWVLPEGVLPHMVRQCVAEYYSSMQGAEEICGLSKTVR